MSTMPQEQHQAAAAAAQERKAMASAGEQKRTAAAPEGKGAGFMATPSERSGGRVPVEAAPSFTGGSSVFTGAPTSLGCFSHPMNPWTHPQSTDPPTWDNNPHPPGGFLSFFNNQLQMSQNFHLVGGPSHCAPFKAPRPVDIGGSSPPLVTTPTLQPDQVPIDVDSGDEVGRTEKRILWTQEEDVRLMSSWLENSTDSAAGADRKNDQY